MRASVIALGALLLVPFVLADDLITKEQPSNSSWSRMLQGVPETAPTTVQLHNRIVTVGGKSCKCNFNFALGGGNTVDVGSSTVSCTPRRCSGSASNVVLQKNTLKNYIFTVSFRVNKGRMRGRITMATVEIIKFVSGPHGGNGGGPFTDYSVWKNNGDISGWNIAVFPLDSYPAGIIQAIQMLYGPSRVAGDWHGGGSDGQQNPDGVNLSQPIQNHNLSAGEAVTSIKGWTVIHYISTPLPRPIIGKLEFTTTGGVYTYGTATTSDIVEDWTVFFDTSLSTVLGFISGRGGDLVDQLTIYFQ